MSKYFFFFHLFIELLIKCHSNTFPNGLKATSRYNCILQPLNNGIGIRKTRQTPVTTAFLTPTVVIDV